MKETKQDQIKVLYLDEGMSVRQISDEIGSSRNSVQATITKFKLNHIRRQTRPEMYHHCPHCGMSFPRDVEGCNTKL